MSGGGIPQFFVPNIHPQVVDQGGAPDFWSAVLGGLQPGMQAGLTGYKEQQQNSRSSAENEIRKAELALQQQHFKLLQKIEDTKQAEFAHHQEITNQVGGAYNEFLKNILPHAVQTGQAQQLMGGMGGMQQGQPQQQPSDQFGIPQGLPFQQAMGGLSGLPQQAQPSLAPATRSTPSPLVAPQGPGAGSTPVDPFQALGAVLPHMDPEAVPILMQHIAPIIGLLQKENNPPLQQADSGKYKTVFDANRGYWNPDSKQWQPQLPKGYTTEELEKQANDRQDRQDRAAAMDAYRADVRGQVASRQFDSVTKDLRSRAALLHQAVLTTHQAQFATDPEQRKILMSTALLNFVQASDQKVNLRYQMVRFVKDNIDSSFSGKWENAISLLSTGQYPAKVYTALEAHLQSLLGQSRGEFERLRAGEVKRRPELNDYLRQPEDVFGDAPGTSVRTPLPPPP